METLVTAPEVVQESARAVLESKVDRTIDKLPQLTPFAVAENLFRNVGLLDHSVQTAVDGKASALAG